MVLIIALSQQFGCAKAALPVFLLLVWEAGAVLGKASLWILHHLSCSGVKPELSN